MGRSLRLFGKKQREVRVENEFEREAGVIAQAGRCGQHCRGAAQMAVAAVVAGGLGCGGGRILIVAAIVVDVVARHPGLHCGRRRVVVPTERHADRGEPLQREPQQQETKNKIAQQLLHVFCAGFGSITYILEHGAVESSRV